MTGLLAGGEPFLLRAGESGVLLLHGFTATPREMRPLGEHLARNGHTVLAPRLFGHATRPDDLARAAWRDWLASAEDGLSLLRDLARAEFAVGMSMGGDLALHLCAAGSFKGVVLLSTPVDLPADPRLRALRPFLGALSRVWRHAPKGERIWFDAPAAAEHLTYPVRPLHALAELDELLAHTRGLLARVTTPTLIVHSRDDRFVGPQNAEYILQALGSTWKEIHWVRGSSHALSLDARREEVFEVSTDFLRRVRDSAA